MQQLSGAVNSIPWLLTNLEVMQPNQTCFSHKYTITYKHRPTVDCSRLEYSTASHKYVNNVCMHSMMRHVIPAALFTDGFKSNFHSSTTMSDGCAAGVGAAVVMATF